MDAARPRIDPAEEPRAWVIAPRGDVDITTCDVLAARLQEVIDSGGLILVLDLREVNFLDSSGIRVILQAARDIDDQGGRLWIENASGAIQRIFEVAGILEHLRNPSPGPLPATLR
jgi:anti-anti-sigma factor